MLLTNNLIISLAQCSLCGPIYLLGSGLFRSPILGREIKTVVRTAILNL